MWWRRSWFSLKGTVDTRVREVRIPPTAGRSLPPQADPCTTLSRAVRQFGLQRSDLIDHNPRHADTTAQTPEILKLSDGELLSQLFRHRHVLKSHIVR